MVNATYGTPAIDNRGLECLGYAAGRNDRGAIERADGMKQSYCMSCEYTCCHGSRIFTLDPRIPHIFIVYLICLFFCLSTLNINYYMDKPAQANLFAHAVQLSFHTHSLPNCPYNILSFLHPFNLLITRTVSCREDWYIRQSGIEFNLVGNERHQDCFLCGSKM
ncbi:hypothetical protein DL96DRAFT_1010238 [Flagelloscypha sp. PMI_526]|nr:hypothetical protein DL96DRAFT_1010238 [Flagelloscypha sp. PMI_526]